MPVMVTLTVTMMRPRLYQRVMCVFYSCPLVLFVSLGCSVMCAPESVSLIEPHEKLLAYLVFILHLLLIHREHLACSRSRSLSHRHTISAGPVIPFVSVRSRPPLPHILTLSRTFSSPPLRFIPPLYPSALLSSPLSSLFSSPSPPSPFLHLPSRLPPLTKKISSPSLFTSLSKLKFVTSSLLLSLVLMASAGMISVRSPDVRHDPGVYQAWVMSDFDRCADYYATGNGAARMMAEAVDPMACVN
jgi:hypothetical protein